MKNTTFCNPISFPDYPRGGNNQFPDENVIDGNFCSLADPDGFFENGVCYLYTSYKAAYTSTNMIDWERHSLSGIQEDDYYAPAVMQYHGKYYLIACSTPVYVSNTPFGPFTSLGYLKTPDQKELPVADPDFFVDDDDRLYMFWGCGREIFGAELDRENPTQMITEPKTIVRFQPEHLWERWGEYNQDHTMGWTEGSCMIKVNGRYYLNYSGCGTTFGKYATGVYYSDISPLEGFCYQKNNPVMTKPAGLMRGGGHSCIIPDDTGNLWAFYTCPWGYSHPFERMIGMDKAWVENGELFCNVSDIPCSLDGKIREDLLPLTFYTLVSSTSSAPGRDNVYAVDDNLQSFWQPDKADEAPTLTVSLRGDYTVGAFRIIRRCLNLDFDAGIAPEPLRYKVEVKTPNGNWNCIYDGMNNHENKLIDYRETEPIVATDARLILKQDNNAVKNAIINFTIFGKKN